MYRLKLHLQKNNQGVVPFNYHFHLANSVIKRLNWTEPFDGLFCIGKLNFDPFKVLKHEGGFAHSDATLELGVMTSMTYQHIYEAFVEKELAIPGTITQSTLTWTVTNVQRIELPTEQTTFNTSSPILIHQKENYRTKYLYPDDPLFKDLFIDSIYRNWLDFSNDKRIDISKVSIHFDKWKSRLITMREGTPQEIKVRAMEMQNLYIKAPDPIIHCALTAGVGHLTNMGLGCISC